MLPFNLRAALQIYFQDIRFFKAQKDVYGGAISTSKVGAKAGGPPFIGRGWNLCSPLISSILTIYHHKKLAQSWKQKVF